MANRRVWRWGLGLGLPLFALGLFIAIFRWDWLIPLAEARASAALGRPVSIEHLHLDLGRTTTVTLEGLRIGNPPGFEAEPPFAEVPRLSLDLDAMALLRDRSLVIPSVSLDQPAVAMRSRTDGQTNYAFNLGGTGAAGQGPQIGALLLRDGKVHAVLAGLRADFTVALSTEEPAGEPPRLLASAEGRYAGQPITAQLRGGAILNLRQPDQPWPIELTLANGPTRVALCRIRWRCVAPTFGSTSRGRTWPGWRRSPACRSPRPRPSG
jgi:hypothetical protein